MITLAQRVRRGLKTFFWAQSEIEIATRFITSNDPRPVKMKQLQFIADKSFNPNYLPEIMFVIWERLFDSHEQYVHVRKAAVLLRYLLTHGHHKIIRHAQNHLQMIETLVYYRTRTHFGEEIRDQAKQIVHLLTDKEFLFQERLKYESLPARLCREAIERESGHTNQAMPRTHESNNFEVESSGSGDLIDFGIVTAQSAEPFTNQSGFHCHALFGAPNIRPADDTPIHRSRFIGPMTSSALLGDQERAQFF